MSSSFPSSWPKRRLSDVAELQLGKMLDKAKNVAGQPMPYLRNVNVRWGEVETSDLYSMRFTEAEAARFSIRDGDLLVCEGGEPGRCAIWKGGPTSLKFQKAIHRIRPSPDVLPEWVALFLRRETLEDRLRDHFTGTTIKHLPAQALAALELPLPPLAEQRRIVISPKHRFFPGQIVYSKIRPYLRKAVLVDFEGGCSADMYPLTVRNEIDPVYLLHWLISENFARFTSDHEGRTVLPKINQQGLARTLVPVPPLHQQRQIGRRLAEIATRTEATARDVARNLTLLDRLEQSILARAFRGELVPPSSAKEQDPVSQIRVEKDMPAAGRRKVRAAAA